MQRHRTLVMFGVAWIASLLLSTWVYKASSGPKRDTVQAVAARKDIGVGKRLVADDLKLVTYDRKDVPPGFASKVADLVDRAVVTPITQNELVLERKLASRGGGDSLTALIEPGMRAVSVKVDDTSSVAGFVQPGTHVDVLFTRILPNGDAATTTVLQNIKVIAYGKQLEAGRTDKAAAAPLAAGGQTVATLLVTQEDAERVALAVQRGRIQLSLRNPLDAEVSEPGEPTRPADLGIADPVRPEPKAAVVKPVAAEKPKTTPGMNVEQQPKQPNNGRITIRVFRGNKVSEDIF